MAEHIRRQDDFRVDNISLDRSVGAGRDGDSAQRSVSLELNSQEIPVVLHHDAHHKARCHRAAKCRRSDRAQAVRFPGILGHASGRAGEGPYVIICCGRSDYVIAHADVLSLSGSSFTYDVITQNSNFVLIIMILIQSVIDFRQPYHITDYAIERLRPTACTSNFHQTPVASKAGIKLSSAVGPSCTKALVKPSSSA